MKPTILLVAVLIGSYGCSSTSPTPGMPAVPKTVTVNIEDDAYNPKSIQINPGDTVRWVLVGVVQTHTVTAMSGQFDSGFAFMQAGDSFEQTFNQDDTTFEYSCDTHQACCLMQGSIRVGGQAPSPRPGY